MGEEESGEVGEGWEGADAGEKGFDVEGGGGWVEEEEAWGALFGEAEGEAGLVGGGDVVGGAAGEDALE